MVHTRRNGAPSDEVTASLVYGLGDRGDPTVVRIEVTLDLWPDGDITYRFAWGMPGGELKLRSAVRMGTATLSETRAV